MAAEVCASLMSRAVKLGLSFVYVLGEGTEERRKEFVFVAFGSFIDLTAEKTSVCKVIVDHTDHVTDEFFRSGVFIAEIKKNRNFQGGGINLV